MDQVRLWEAETTRVRYTPSYMYQNFETRQLYSSAVEYARNQGLMLWSNPEQMMFAAKESGARLPFRTLMHAPHSGNKHLGVWELVGITCLYHHVCLQQSVCMCDCPCRTRAGAFLHQGAQGCHGSGGVARMMDGVGSECTFQRLDSFCARMDPIQVPVDDLVADASPMPLEASALAPPADLPPAGNPVKPESDAYDPLEADPHAMEPCGMAEGSLQPAEPSLEAEAVPAEVLPPPPAPKKKRWGPAMNEPAPVPVVEGAEAPEGEKKRKRKSRWEKEDNMQIVLVGDGSNRAIMAVFPKSVILSNGLEVGACMHMEDLLTWAIE